MYALRIGRPDGVRAGLKTSISSRGAPGHISGRVPSNPRCFFHGAGLD